MTIERLVEESKKGNIDSKLELLNRCKPLILASIKKYHARGDYDDLIQEGNLLILESIDSFDGSYGVYFMGYIQMKLRFLYLNINSNEEWSLNREDENGLEFLERIESSFDMEEYILVWDENIDLYRKINILSPREKEIIEKFYFDDMTIGEIAQYLSLTYQTVANIKTNGINKLRKIVKRQG